MEEMKKSMERGTGAAKAEVTEDDIAAIVSDGRRCR